MQPFALQLSPFGSRNSLPPPHEHHPGRGKGEQWVLSSALHIKNPRQSRLFLLTRFFFILNPTREKKRCFLLIGLYSKFLFTSSGLLHASL